MADDLVVSTSAGGPNSSVPNNTRFSLEEVSNLNGGAVTSALVQRIIMAMRTGDGTALDVNSTNPMPVSMTTAPLGTGAATAANQATANTALAAIQAAVDGLEGVDYATQTTLAAILTKLNASLAVTGTFWQATQPVSAASLPLPTGAATEAELESITAALLSILSAIGDLATGAETQPVSAASLPLPTGAATSAKQDTAQTALDAIKTAVETLDNTVAGSELQVDIVAALPAGTNAIGKLAANSGVDIGDVDVTSLPAIPAGSNTIGAVNVKPATSGGLTPFRLVSAASTNATSVKASAGQLFGWYIYNSNAAARKVAFHNTAGTPTAGSGVVFAVTIPPGSAANVEFTNGIAFSTGIAITTVTGMADSDSTGVGANDLGINLFYA